MTIQIIPVEFRIPQVLFDEGLVDAYALAKGYQEKVFDKDENGLPILDENGEPNVYDNPMSKVDFVKESLHQYLQADFKAFMERNAVQQAVEAAKAQVDTEFEQIMGEVNA